MATRAEHGAKDAERTATKAEHGVGDANKTVGGADHNYMVTLDGTVYKFTTKTMPLSIGEVVREFHPMHGWVGKR